MLNRTTNRAPVSRRIRTAATASMVTLAVVVAAASVSARSDPHTAGDVALAPAAVQSPAVVTQEEFNALLRQMESLETVAADLTIDRARLNAAVTQAVGGLTGTVRDPSGGVLPGVQITLTDRAGQQRTATTDAAGMFRFLELESVEYDLVARLPGFRTLQAPVSVGGDTSQLSLAMQIGALQETITVTGSRTQPDVSSPTRVAASPRPPSAAAGRGVAPRPPATPNVITGVATVGNVTVGGSAGPTLPVRVGGQIKQPTKTLHVNPVYPGELQADGVEGVVILEAVIGPDGKVQDPRVLRSIPGLDQSAVDAVRQWEFTPTLLNNAPVPVVMTVTVQYRLQ